MKEIIEIIAVVGLFIFFFYFLYRIYFKSSKKEEKKEEKKSAPAASEKKEDIPEILKEVTMGNYMHDISKKVVVEQSVMKEDDKIIDQFDIEKAFDIIDSQDLEDVEIEEIEDDIVSEIEVDMDSVILGVDVEDDETDVQVGRGNGKNLAEEYANLSGNMKALIIANFLDKKNHDN